MQLRHQPNNHPNSIITTRRDTERTIIITMVKLQLLVKKRQVVIGLYTRIITGTTKEITTTRKVANSRKKAVKRTSSVIESKTKIMIKVIKLIKAINKITLQNSSSNHKKLVQMQMQVEVRMKTKIK